jgi:hypothetical protein
MPGASDYRSSRSRLPDPRPQATPDDILGRDTGRIGVPLQAKCLHPRASGRPPLGTNKIKDLPHFRNFRIMVFHAYPRVFRILCAFSFQFLDSGRGPAALVSLAPVPADRHDHARIATAYQNCLCRKADWLDLPRVRGPPRGIRRAALAPGFFARMPIITMRRDRSLLGQGRPVTRVFSGSDASNFARHQRAASPIHANLSLRHTQRPAR